MIAAFDIDSDLMRYVLGNEEGEFQSDIYEVETRPENLEEQVITAIEQLEGQKEEVEKVSISSTGIVDRNEKKIVHFDTSDHDSVESIGFPKVEKPLVIENDCNTAALGEYRFGRASEYDCSVHITIDEGIGAGIITDGEIFKGEGNAGEVGLIPLILDFNHHSYNVQGAWEAFASRRGLDEFLKKQTGLDISNPTYKKIKEAKDENEEIMEIWRMLNEVNAAGIASVINSFNPGYVSIGGKMVLESEDLLENIKKNVSQNAFVDMPDIAFVKTKERVQLYGALALAKRNF